MLTVETGLPYITLRTPLLSLAHICTPSFPSLSTLEHLYIYEIEGIDDIDSDWERDFEDTELLELLRPFRGGGMTEVFPTLENIFVEAPAKKELRSLSPHDSSLVSL